MTVLYLEWCFSVDSAASLLRNTVAQGPAPPVHDIKLHTTSIYHSTCRDKVVGLILKNPCSIVSNVSPTFQG